MKKLIYVIFILLVSVSFIYAQDSTQDAIKLKNYEIPPYKYVQFKYDVEYSLTHKQIISELQESIDYFHEWDKHTKSKFEKGNSWIKGTQNYEYIYNLDSGKYEFSVNKIVFKTFQEAYNAMRTMINSQLGDSFMLPEKLPETPAIIKANQFNDIIIVKKGNTYVFAITLNQQIELSYYLNKRSDGFMELIYNGLSW